MNSLWLLYETLPYTYIALHQNRIKASTYNNVLQKILYRLASDQEVQLSKKYRMWKESKLPNNVLI